MITLADIRGLALLARLKLTGKEEGGLQKDISNILEYVGQLRRSEVGVPTETSGVSKQAVHNVMRADEPYKPGAILLGKREALLKAFPQREGDYLVVRKILEK